MMKKTILMCVFCGFLSCSSTKSFQSFFNTYKNDIGVTAFQVPNFMKALLGRISPEMNGLFGTIQDFKFITFNDISAAKQQQLIQNMTAVTASNYTDILRQNTTEKTKIISVIEAGDVVKKAIIFNSTLQKTSVFYLKGDLDPNNLKALSETNQFETLSNTLMQNYQFPGTGTPKFNPNN